MKNLKFIFSLMFVIGMIAFTACSSELENQNDVKKNNATELTQRPVNLELEPEDTQAVYTVEDEYLGRTSGKANVKCVKAINFEGQIHVNGCTTVNGNTYAVSLVYQNGVLIESYATVSNHYCDCNFN